jgi:RimJ/RimL family protein N-acetyltransferase
MHSLQTPRLRLVPLSLEDAHAILEGRRPVEDRWAPDYPTDATLVVSGMLVTAAAEGRDFGPWTAYQMIRRSDDMVIGGVGFALGEPDPDGAVHLTYSIVDSEAHEDYAAEGVGAMIAFARSQEGVTRVVAETSQTNLFGIHVYESAGMKRAGGDQQLVFFEA